MPCDEGFPDGVTDRSVADAALAVLHRTVFRDPALQARLFALDNASEFTAAVERLARSLGHVLEEGELARAMQAGQRAWFERKLP